MNTLLADIGNTYFHIYNGKTVEHLNYDDAISKYKDTELSFISVKHQLSREISGIKKWKNISSLMSIEDDYETMGIDRKALCNAFDDGVFVDAGSAITVDVMENGKYQGGFILLGLSAFLASYKSISPALSTQLDRELSLHSLARTTKEQISYGIIASIKAIIEKHSSKKRLYFTGGDGKFLSSFFEDADYDETLVFQGMQNALKDNNHRVSKDNKIC